MTLRRGFKTEANDVAREVRATLGLRLADPLDPWALARDLGVPLVPLSEFRRDAGIASRHFATMERGAFSAMTVFDGSRRMIVYNDAHSRGRQASDIAHELSHALLQHRPGAALDVRGCRDWDQEQEEEADWLAGALLVSEEAALVIARSGAATHDAALSYGVSPRMLQFRLNMTGARRRAALGKRRRRP
ncbi:MAG: ImmA/IrrE family metallo-endopeptidase [Chloroflexi bacterium]|nr:ImmA/IrrE family metallo-endopeptidase [Chloroflexota bacterium]